MHVSLRQLEIVQAVAETRSVSAAAKRLNISQPAVTRYVRDIEQKERLVLFDRTARGMVATTAGTTLIHRARAVGAELRALEGDFQALRGSSTGRLAIGVTPAATYPVPRAISRLLASSPDVSVELTEDMRPRLLPALRAGELDLVLATQPADGSDEGLIDQVLFHNRLRVVARSQHPLAQRKAIGAADLIQCKWVLPTPDLSPRLQLEVAFHQARVPPPRQIVVTNSTRMQREILLSGDFLSVMVSEAARDDVQLGLIKLLAVDLVLPPRPIAIIMRRSAETSPVMLTFINILKDELGRREGINKPDSVPSADDSIRHTGSDRY